MRYDAHEILVAPARASASPRRLIAGTALAVALFFGFIYAFSVVAGAFFTPDGWEAFGATLDTGTTPASVLVNLYLFGFVIAALAVALRQVHARRLIGLIGPLPLALAQFRRVCLYLLGLHVALSMLLPGDPGFQPTPNLAPGPWLAFLPLAIPAVLLQTTAEEMVFRGYLQSQLAARFARPAVWILVPSVLFGLLHYDTLINGDNAWLVVLWATTFGIATADLTARAGTLGPAIGLHFMNNCVAILLAAPKDNFDGLALYTYPFAMDDSAMIWAWAPVDLMVLLCGWLAARLALRR